MREREGGECFFVVAKLYVEHMHGGTEQRAEQKTKTKRERRLTRPMDG